MRRSINCSGEPVPQEYERAVDTAMDHLQVTLGGMEFMLGMPAMPVLDALLSIYVHLALNTLGEQETLVMIARLTESIPAVIASKKLATESSGSA